MAWLLVGYIYLYLCPPPEFLGERPILNYSLFLIVAWAFSLSLNPVGAGKRLCGNLFTLALCLYLLAITLSSVFSNYINLFDNEPLQRVIRNHAVFFVVLMTSVRTEKDLKIIVTGLVVTISIYMGQVFWQYLQGNIYRDGAPVDRIAVLEGRRAPGVNSLGALLVIILPLILTVVTLCKKYWHYLFVLGYVLLTLRIVMLTGSRTTLLMLTALAILAVLVSRYRFRWLPVLLLAFVVGWSILPEDMQNRYRTIWDHDLSRGANVSRESRVNDLYAGLELWTRNPIFGIGPHGSHGMFLHTGYLHSLVGQLTGELGTVGTMAFLFLLSCIGINHYNIWKNYKYLQEKNLGKEGLYCWRLSIAVMYGIVAALVNGLGEANAWHFSWFWFGAFQALAALFMQEKVAAAMRGQLLPGQPIMLKRR